MRSPQCGFRAARGQGNCFHLVAACTSGGWERMRNLTVIAAFMAVAVAAGCAGSSSSPAAGVIGVTPGAPPGGGGGSSRGGGGGAPGPDTVNVGNDFFSPSSLTVPAGTLVTWNWLPGDVIHTVTFDADTTIMS